MQTKLDVARHAGEQHPADSFVEFAGVDADEPVVHEDEFIAGVPDALVDGVEPDIGGRDVVFVDNIDRRGPNFLVAVQLFL